MPVAAPPEPWHPPVATGPLDATVAVPGSKSQTARLLVLAALAESASRLRAPLHARDTELMAAAIGRLGAQVSMPPDCDDWLIEPVDEPVGGTVVIDVGLSGTVTRFLPAVAALSRARVSFDGDARMRERPVGALLTALTELGATVDAPRPSLPFAVCGTAELPGGEVTLDASLSSQLISGLLLAGPRMTRGVTVRHHGPPVPSQPYLDMTVAELRRFGADVDDSRPDRWQVRPGSLAGVDVSVEPDLSSATPFLLAALVAGGSIRLPGWPAATTQPGGELPQLLDALGADAAVDAGGLTVCGGAGIPAVDLDLRDFSEATPCVAAVALFADGPSRIRGVAHLRTHETDRLRALVEEFGRLGADVRETPDGVEIRPAPLSGATLDPRGDHRMAMAYGLVALRVPDIRIIDPASLAKTVPDFQQRWTQMTG